MVGAAEIIPPDDGEDENNNKGTILNNINNTATKQSFPKQPTTIPFEQGSFHEELITKLTSIDFNNNSVCETELLDSRIKVYQIKQQLLVTLNKRLGHLSYYKIKVLCMGGILPREPSDIDPLICLGCTYGKAKRKPWRRKGSKTESL